MKYILIAACTFFLVTSTKGDDKQKKGQLTSVSPNPKTLKGKVMFGYQGWHGTPNDGSGVNGWKHWFRNSRPDSAHALFDFWPDMREYPEAALSPTDMFYRNGKPAKLYSSYNYQTVDLHFKWMQDYNLDGVFQQRFITEIKRPPGKKHFDQVVRNVKRASEKYQRVYCIMYDISGGGKNWKELLMNDWKFLVDSLKLTEGDSYLFHKEKPLVAIWGLGFEHNSFASDKQADSLINWFHRDAPKKYQATVFGGVNDNWSNHSQVWKSVYAKMDVISPWAVGRYGDFEGADNFAKNKVIPDIIRSKDQGTDYMPVVFPGFSWYNLRQGRSAFNQIPRRGGEFFWKQASNVMKAGAEMIYIAMFDEVDEGTAMYKLAESVRDKPHRTSFLSLDECKESQPSDWYLKLSSLTSDMLKGAVPKQYDFLQVKKKLNK